MVAACPGVAIEALQAGIAYCERRMLECVAADDGLSHRCAIIQSVPGLGPVNAVCACAEMPELASLNCRPTAALLGLAPFDQDSGHHRGGRAQPRHLLYMAALCAIRWNLSSKAC